jgi:hypothetical protein
MIPALSVAVAGLVDASNRLGGAASRTVSETARFANSLNQGNAPPTAAPAGTSATRDLSRTTRTPTPGGQPLYIPSFAEDAVAMRTAVAAYKANAKLVRVTSELSAELARLGQTTGNRP